MKYTGDISDAIGDVKRLYADLKITRECPNCGEDVVHDFNQDYVSYGEGTLYFYCYDGCEHEWEVEAEYSATLIVETKEQTDE